MDLATAASFFVSSDCDVASGLRVWDSEVMRGAMSSHFIWAPRWQWLDWLQWALVPIVGAVIGWGTNVVAIRMLFHPRRPWRVPLLGWQVQGVLPRRQPDLARQLGEVVERELFRIEDLAPTLAAPEVRCQVATAVARRVGERIDEWLPPILPSRWREGLIQTVRDVACRESESLLTSLLPELVAGLRERVSVSALVEARVRSLKLDELETLILELSRRELHLIEVLGGVLGFAVGLMQLLIMLAMGHLIP